MTANPLKPARYRPGKPTIEEPSSEEEEEYEDDDFEEEEESAQEHAVPTAPPPKATSFPSDATRIASNLKKVDLNERRRQAAAAEAVRLEAEKAARAAEEEGFVTEQSEEEGIEGEEGSGSEGEESSSEDEAPRVLLRPTFLKKDKRKDLTTVVDSRTEDEAWAEEETRRKKKANSLIQEQLEKNAAAQAAGKKHWDDDEEEAGEQVDDTDNLDPETERAAWKLRELKRVKREREAIEIAEKEREETERRRNLSKEEREAEDREFLNQQQEDREGRGKMGYMQKYFHKGAFFQDDAKAEGLDQRDIMGSRYQDDVTNRELLPQYMQIRDMAKLGRKGRTKYKDLKTEDTGRWGTAPPPTDRTNPHPANHPSLDERFQPDRDARTRGASGANATQINDRRTRAPPSGGSHDDKRPPRARDVGGQRREDERYRARSPSPRRRSPSPRRRSPSPRRRSPSPRQRSPSPRQGSPSPRRKRSYSRSRSPSRRRGHHGDDRRKRSPSPDPYRDQHRDRDRDRGDKRRKLDI